VSPVPAHCLFGVRTLPLNDAAAVRYRAYVRARARTEVDDAPRPEPGPSVASHSTGWPSRPPASLSRARAREGLLRRSPAASSASRVPCLARDMPEAGRVGWLLDQLRRVTLCAPSSSSSLRRVARRSSVRPPAIGTPGDLGDLAPRPAGATTVVSAHAAPHDATGSTFQSHSGPLPRTRATRIVFASWRT
jgi:hypothetical protein